MSKDFTLLTPWNHEGSARHPREPGQDDRVIIFPVIKIERRGYEAALEHAIRHVAHQMARPDDSEPNKKTPGG